MSAFPSSRVTPLASLPRWRGYAALLAVRWLSLSEGFFGWEEDAAEVSVPCVLVPTLVAHEPRRELGEGGWARSMIYIFIRCDAFFVYAVNGYCFAYSFFVGTSMACLPAAL